MCYIGSAVACGMHRTDTLSILRGSILAMYRVEEFLLGEGMVDSIASTKCQRIDICFSLSTLFKLPQTEIIRLDVSKRYRI